MLRPYQTEALKAVKNRNVDRGIIAIPTGTGKGHISGHLTEALGTQKILYLAHREELIDQLFDHVERVLGFGKVSVEQASRRSNIFSPVVVASIPTLTANKCKRLKRLGEDRFEALVCDEAHHSTAETYLKIWQHFGILDENKKKVDIPSIPLIGLTATPSRGDKVGLNNVYDDILYQMSLAKAIEDGWLVPIYAFTIRTSTSLDGIRTRMGDYSEKELSARVINHERNEVIYDAYLNNAKDLKTLIFCVNIEHAESVAEYFNNHHGETIAKHVSGKMKKDERRYIFNWFKRTPGAVLTNCQLVTEGVDIPSVECVIMARPTKSKTLYAQALGRGTRLAKGAKDYDESVVMGKDRLILLDITDNTTDVGRRAVNISDIFGAPLPNKELKGTEMLDELKEQQEIVEKARHGEYIGTEAIPINLFAKAAVLPGATMAWQDYGDMYRLSLAKSGDVTLVTDTLDRWSAVYFNSAIDEDVSIFSEISNQKDIVTKVERWVKKNHKDKLALVSSDASWRGESPSKAQRDFCKRIGLQIPAGATKGDVSMAIDKRLASLKKKKKVEAS